MKSRVFPEPDQNLHCEKSKARFLGWLAVQTVKQRYLMGFTEEQP